MPWFNKIDAGRPTDVEFVSEGAERFRELKRALIERFGTAYAGFPGENPDRAGEQLLFPIVSVMVGTRAQRPDVPAREGHGWFSVDTGILSIGNKMAQWQDLDFGIFIPAPPSVKAVKRTSQQTIVATPSGPTPLIEFHGQDIDYQDNGEFFDANVSNTEFKIPETGKYLLTAGVAAVHNLANNDFDAMSTIRVNDTGVRAARAVSSFFFYQESLAVQMALNAGDKVELGLRPINRDVIISIGGFTGLEIMRLDREQIGEAPSPPPSGGGGSPPDYEYEYPGEYPGEYPPDYEYGGL